MIDIIFLVIWWLFWLVSIRVNHKTPLKVGLLILVMGTLGIFVAQHYYRAHYPIKVVQASTLLHVGPDDSYGVCGTLAAQDQVVVHKIHGPWAHVSKAGSWSEWLRGQRPSGWVVHTSLDVP